METNLSLFLLIFISVEARGPHHPRSEIRSHHIHHQPKKDAKLTEDTDLLHDKVHIQEHLEEVIDTPDFSKMSDEELEFYYFQVHDTDKNSKLDGLEILQALYHTAHESHNDGDAEAEVNATIDGDVTFPKDDFDFYVEIIDGVLREDDLDKDGYLSYVEYVNGRKRTSNSKNIDIAPVVKMVP